MGFDGAYLEQERALGLQGGANPEDPMGLSNLLPEGTSARNHAMQAAYRKNFVTFSTNLVAMHQGASKSCGAQFGNKRCPPWPSLTC